VEKTEERRYTGESYLVVDAQSENKREEKRYPGGSYWVVEVQEQDIRGEIIEIPTE
jgi:hypothetical protein